MNDRALISQWVRSQEVAKDYDLVITYNSSRFLLEHSRKGCLGGFECVSDLYHFLMGYQWVPKEDGNG